MSKEFMRRYTLERELKDLEQPHESIFDFQMKMAFETMVESFAKKSDKEIIDFLYKKYMNTDVKDVFLLSETDFKQFLLETLPKWREEKHYLKWEDLEFEENKHNLKCKMNDSLYYIEWFVDGMGFKTLNIYLDVNKEYLRYCAYLQDDKKQFFNDLHLERVEE